MIANDKPNILLSVFWFIEYEVNAPVDVIIKLFELETDNTNVKLVADIAVTIEAFKAVISAVMVV